MTPGSRTISLDQPDLDDQLRSPTKKDDSATCYPWGSRGRRLFPQHRTSILNSVSGKLNLTPCFSPFESSPSNLYSFVGPERYDSMTSSPSSAGSVATVQVHIPSTAHRPSAETDSRFGESARVRMSFSPGPLPEFRSAEREITSHKSVDKSAGISCSAALYADAPVRGNLRWKSLAHFHQSRCRPSLRMQSQLPNDKNGPCDSIQSYDALAPMNGSFNGSLPVQTQPCDWSQSPKITTHPRSPPIEFRQDSGMEEDTYLASKDHFHFEAPALKIATWDCTVNVSTVATVAGDGKLHVHHLALLSVIIPTATVYAEKVSLSFMISNALRNDHECSLRLGQSSLVFKEDVSNPGFFPREGAELTVVRNSCDLVKPLNLYFIFTYPCPWHSLVASMPTFRPKKGRSLSEVVFIAEPQPPLSMKTYIRDPPSSWRLCQHPVSQVTCYERINLPEPYPARFQDDILMKFLKLDPVCFRALGESTLTSVVWKLDITVHELPDEQIECRMSFLVEVGEVTALLTLIPYEWVPRYFIINGYVATDKAGECWQNEEGYITIFKQAYMGPGPVMVETYWQKPSKDGNYDVGSTYNLPLPSVANRKVLGGRLTCLADTVILLNHLGERICSYGPIDGTYTLLPTMDTGYKILLKRVIGPRALKFRRPIIVRRPSLPIFENTQLSEQTVISPKAEAKTGHGRVLSHTVNHANGEATPPKHTLQSLSLALIILLLLVPSSLLFVEHVRKGDHRNEPIVWREQDPSVDGERPQAIVNVADSEHLQAAVIGADKPVEVAKCEGWRDWIDYGSGWKGCVP